MNITVSTTLKQCYKKALNKKLKLMGAAMKYFSKKLLGHEIFRSAASWAANFFRKICNITAHAPTYLMYGPLFNFVKILMVKDQQCTTIRQKIELIIDTIC